MRTIKRTAASEPVVKKVAGTSHPLTGQPIFSTYRDLLCFCTVLGFENEARKPLEGDLVDFVDGRIFSNHELSIDLLYLIALAETRDMFILRDSNEDKQIQILEEYANGGLEVLSDWLKDKPEDVHGDDAIISALASRGYLGVQGASPQDATESVTF
jgi:dnd system-associated protein 4